ncbi:MAG: hypothetical protein ABUL62_32985 [Myxococcales bacterium]|jgi:hypothetical protein
MTTTNLSITSKDTSSGDHDCQVISQSPLYIKELLLCPIAGLGAPLGRVNPGTPIRGVLRSIYLNSTHPVFTRAAPFTLAVTYDPNNNYVVSNVQLVSNLQNVAALLAPLPEALAQLNPEEQTHFSTGVLEIIGSPPNLEAAAVPPGGTPPGKPGKPYTSDNGKDSSALS